MNVDKKSGSERLSCFALRWVFAEAWGCCGGGAGLRVWGLWDACGRAEVCPPGRLPLSVGELAFVSPLAQDVWRGWQREGRGDGGSGWRFCASVVVREKGFFVARCRDFASLG